MRERERHTHTLRENVYNPNGILTPRTTPGFGQAWIMDVFMPLILREPLNVNLDPTHVISAAEHRVLPVQLL